MIDWISAARLVDVALVCIVIEALLLWMFRHRWMRLSRAGGVAANVISGGTLLLAIRIAIGGGHWTLIALCLTAALAAHLADLGLRFKPVAKADS